MPTVTQLSPAERGFNACILVPACLGNHRAVLNEVSFLPVLLLPLSPYIQFSLLEFWIRNRYSVSTLTTDPGLGYFITFNQKRSYAVMCVGIYFAGSGLCRVIVMQLCS